MNTFPTEYYPDMSYDLKQMSTSLKPYVHSGRRCHKIVYSLSLLECIMNI